MAESRSVEQSPGSLSNPSDVTGPAGRGVPLSLVRTGNTADRRIESCACCGGRFPAPGVDLRGRIYCCDKCATGPSAGMKARMLLMPAALVVASAAAGWLAARTDWNGWIGRKL